jgi:hypothetical protein
MQLRNLELEKAESHPARRADLGPVPPTWLRDLGIKFGMPDLVTPGDDRIGKILPNDGQKLAGGSVPTTCEHRRPADPDHRVATPREPVDVRHVMKFDRDHRFAGQGEPFRQMLFQHHGIGQEARRDGETSWTALRVDHDIARHLARSGRRSEMRRHPIDVPGLEPIAHRSSPFIAKHDVSLTCLSILTSLSTIKLTPLSKIK